MILERDGTRVDDFRESAPAGRSVPLSFTSASARIALCALIDVAIQNFDHLPPKQGLRTPPGARGARIVSLSRFSGADMCHSRVSMRDPEIIETELMEIGAIADDTIKLERIIAWCASHPDEIPFALHQLIDRHYKPSETS